MDECIESDIVFKWTNCCRLCLTSQVDIDIFNSEESFREISIKFRTSLNLLVYRGDPMPRKLCQNCFNQLDAWHRFRLQCHKTEANLKKRLSSYRMLDFVQEFFQKDEAFHSYRGNNFLMECSRRDVSTLPENIKPISVITSREGQQSSQEPADSTNTHYIGMPIKLEPIEEVVMQTDMRFNNLTTNLKKTITQCPKLLTRLEHNISPHSGCDDNSAESTMNEDNIFETTNKKEKSDDTFPNGPTTPKEQANHDVLFKDNILTSKKMPQENKAQDISIQSHGLAVLHDLADVLETSGRRHEESDCDLPINSDVQDNISLSSSLVNPTMTTYENDKIVGCPKSLEAFSNESPRKKGNCVRELRNLLKSPQWTDRLNPGCITSVEGRALSVWQSQPTNLSNWSQDSSVVVKEEPLSPPDNTNLETNENSFDGDKSYFLRPRIDSVVHYSEIEEWPEDVDMQPPKPVRQKVTPWKCTACVLHFASKNALHLHQSSTHCIGRNMPTFQCHVCSRKFFAIHDLAEHNVAHAKIALDLTEIDLFPCRKCDLNFADDKRRREHLKKHLVGKTSSLSAQYTCSDCKLVFTKKSSFEAHRYTHQVLLSEPNQTKKEITLTMDAPSNQTGSKRDFACSLCISRFKSEDLLYDHRFATHGIPDERVACGMCGDKFRGPLALEEHMKSHQSRSVARKTTKPFSLSSLLKLAPISMANGAVRCRRCGCVFGSREELARHESVKHKNVAPYWCRKCRRRFPTRSLLLMHHRTHYGNEQPRPGTPPALQPQQPTNMQCVSCQIQFKLTADYKQHMEIHAKAEGNILNRIRHLIGCTYSFQCPACPQLFVQKESWIRHMVFRHAGDTSEVLKLLSPVTRFELNVAANEERANCKMCDIQFSSRASLNFHVRKKHKNLNVKDQSSGNAEAVAEKEVTKCPYCSVMVGASHIQTHVAFQHGLKPSEVLKKKTEQARVKCRYCSKVCSNGYNLLKHEETHTAIPGPDWVCQCGKKFAFKAKINFKSHMERCLRKLGKKSAKNAPAESAPPVLKFTCSVCHKFYENRGQLESHVMAVHRSGCIEQETAGEVPREKDLWREECNKIVREINGMHRCTLCQVDFENLEASSWHRTQHPRGNLYVVQIDDHLYQCTVCDKLFNGRENALQHAEYHAEADIKPTAAQLNLQMLNCPFCSSKFTSEENMQSHILYVHPGGSTSNV